MRKIKRRIKPSKESESYDTDDIRRWIKRRTKENLGKFNSTTRRIIIEALRARLSLVRASELAGITRMALWNWLEKGHDPEKYPVHYQFLLKVNQIKSDHERESLEIIRQAAMGGKEFKEKRIKIGGKEGIERTDIVKQILPQWQAAAWYLERTNQQEYARRFISNDKEEESPEQIVRRIKAAYDSLYNSVPIENPNEKSDGIGNQSGDQSIENV